MRFFVKIILLFYVQQCMGQRSLYEGFYVCTEPKKMILLIHENKIHGFTKNRLTSMQKLEEYDFSGLNKDKRLQITASYWQDRNGRILKRNTLIADIEPIVEQKECVALLRNGWRFEKAKNFQTVFDMLKNDYSSAPEILKIGKDKYHWSDSEAQEALQSEDFYVLCKLHLEKLRGGELDFAELVNRIIELDN